MKILLVGVFNFGSTDNWKKLALERLGHRVVCAPYRDRDVAEHFPIGVPFDVVFVSKGVPLTEVQIAHLATLGKHRLLWWPDPFENWPWELTVALRTGDWCLSATPKAVLTKIACVVGPDFVRVRADRILEGCDCEGPRPEWVPDVIEPRLLHFGALTPRRVEIIGKIRAAGVEVDVLERPTYGAQLQKAVLSHAAVLGINSSPDLYSNRVQTVLAMGGRLLQEDAPGLYDEVRSAIDGVPEAMETWTIESVDRVARWMLTAPMDYAADVSRARELYEFFRWERVMERALAFATSGAA